jgi:hypothetical protein
MNFGVPTLQGMTCCCNGGERESRVRWSSSVAKVGGGGTEMAGRWEEVAAVQLCLSAAE